MDWQPDMSKAPRDGTAIRVKRVHEGDVIYDGPAVWRTVTFPVFMNGGIPEPAYEATGWMRVNADKRVPEPTHWMPPAP